MIHQAGREPLQHSRRERIWRHDPPVGVVRPWPFVQQGQQPTLVTLCCGRGILPRAPWVAKLGSDPKIIERAGRVPQRQLLEACVAKQSSDSRILGGCVPFALHEHNVERELTIRPY